MPSRRCAECGAAAKMNCGHCKVILYCSPACQKRNWRLHKRVCSTESLLRPYIPVEMGIERSLEKQPPIDQAPKDGMCYICLEGEDEGKLMRGCACRGESAGFVHLECLTKLAVSKESSRDPRIICDGWTKCGSCKQNFQGVLDLEMTRRFWRRHRSRDDEGLFYNSTTYLATCLGDNGEVDVVNQLLDDASNCVGNDDLASVLDLKLLRAVILAANNQNHQALELLEAILPEAKQFTTDPEFYLRTLVQMAKVFPDLGRNQEAHATMADVVALAKANYSPDDSTTIAAMEDYAVICAKIGRVDESKIIFNEVLTKQIRIYGRDHPYTLETRAHMHHFNILPTG